MILSPAGEAQLSTWDTLPLLTLVVLSPSELTQAARAIRMESTSNTVRIETEKVYSHIGEYPHA